MAQGSSSHCLASIPQVVSETETPDPWISQGNMTLALPLWEEKPFCPPLESTSLAPFLDQPRTLGRGRCCSVGLEQGDEV